MFRCSSSLFGGVLLRGGTSSRTRRGAAAAGFWKSTTTTNNIIVGKRFVSDLQVREGMEQWIQKYVIDHQLCPFAANNRSNHRIVVYSSPTVFELAGLVSAEVEKLLEDRREEGRIPSSFLVFPYEKRFNNFQHFDGLTYRIFMMNQEDSAVEHFRYHPDFQKPFHEYLQEKIGQALPNDAEEIKFFSEVWTRNRACGRR